MCFGYLKVSEWYCMHFRLRIFLIQNLAGVTMPYVAFQPRSTPIELGSICQRWRLDLLLELKLDMNLHSKSYLFTYNNCNSQMIVLPRTRGGLVFIVKTSGQGETFKVLICCRTGYLSLWERYCLSCSFTSVCHKVSPMSSPDFQWFRKDMHKAV